jgi:hypothetical protein
MGLMPVAIGVGGKGEVMFAAEQKAERIRVESRSNASRQEGWRTAQRWTKGWVE